MQSLEELQRDWSTPGRVSWHAGKGGLTMGRISAGRSTAEFYLHGGHVTHFAREGEPPFIFVSEESLYQHDKPIRGGVPICFPWFGPRANDPVGGSPMHGFARLMEWDLEMIKSDAENAHVLLKLRPNSETKKWWDAEFEATLEIDLTNQLGINLVVENRGDKPFTFESALHTYFAVGDVGKIRISGLDGVEYIDKTDNLARKLQSGDVAITSETDRVYLNTQSACVIDDAGNGRKIQVAKMHSDATVVWNPWIAKAKAMADFGDDEWRGMVCVETCNVGAHAVTLDPGQSRPMSVRIG